MTALAYSRNRGLQSAISLLVKYTNSDEYELYKEATFYTLLINSTWFTLHRRRLHHHHHRRRRRRPF